MRESMKERERRLGEGDRDLTLHKSWQRERTAAIAYDFPTPGGPRSKMPLREAS
jgi:chloramphenicol 3-O-phosphotransferase